RAEHDERHAAQTPSQPEPPPATAATEAHPSCGYPRRPGPASFWQDPTRMKPAVSTLALMLIGCAAGGGTGGGSAPAGPKGVTCAGGDGLSCETRVVIRGAAGEMDGVAAEHAWLRARYPGSK